jgi:hypothetical protein
MFVEVDDSHGRLFFGERNGDSTANAAVSAGNESNFSFQFTSTAVSRFFELKPGLHFAFAAGLLRLSLLRSLLSFLWHNCSCLFIRQLLLSCLVGGMDYTLSNELIEKEIREGRRTAVPLFCNSSRANFDRFARANRSRLQRATYSAWVSRRFHAIFSWLIRRPPPHCRSH